MKSDVLPSGFPTSPEEWEKLIRAAPGKDRAPTPEEEAAWEAAVVVREGGISAVRAALETRTVHGRRGRQKSPTKVSVTVRYSPEVVEYFRATGEGWQTRMNDALKAWIAAHPPAGSPQTALMGKP